MKRVAAQPSASPAPGGPPHPTVMVVGGYGMVGRHLCRRLASRRGLQLVVAGRRAARGQSFAAEIGAAFRRLDVNDRATWSAADRVDVVVMCIDQTGDELAARILRRGGAYIDITASDAFFQRLEGQAPRQGYALLSVGLAPGLTNLMAVSAASRLDEVRRIRIGLLSGLGDRHGAAGLDWAVKQVFGGRGGGPAAELDFGAPFGVRRVHRVDFSDQHALRRSLGAEVSTGLCFDSRLATWAAFGLARRIGGSRGASRAVRLAWPALALGSRVCNIAVAAEGVRAGRAVTETLRFFARDEARTTGELAALAVERCLDARPAPGVWHIHQLFRPDDMLAETAARGLGRFEGLPPPTMGVTGAASPALERVS